MGPVHSNALVQMHYLDRPRHSMFCLQLDDNMTMEATIRVFVVDDHPVVRSGLRTMIESTADFALSGMAASSEEALATLGLTETNVLLLDLRMPGMDGRAEAHTSLSI